MHLLNTRLILGVAICNDTWAVINGQSTKAIYSSRVSAATSGEIIRRRYTSFNNQLVEIILFNQEKIVVHVGKISINIRYMRTYSAAYYLV